MSKHTPAPGDSTRAVKTIDDSPSQVDGIHDAEETIRAADLPTISFRQHAFVVNIACKGMTQYEAYKAAYDSTTTIRATIDASASRLRKDPKITAWINHYRINGAKLSAEEHMAEMSRLRDLALKMGNPSAAITAETQRGKVSRLYVETVEVSDRRRLEPEELAKMAAGGDPELAERLAAQLRGVPIRH